MDTYFKDDEFEKTLSEKGLIGVKFLVIKLCIENNYLRIKNLILKTQQKILKSKIKRTKKVLEKYEVQH